jgi:hypothetical protein
MRVIRAGQIAPILNGYGCLSNEITGAAAILAWMPPLLAGDIALARASSGNGTDRVADD